MSAVAWFFLGLVAGLVMLFAVLALCAAASDDWRTRRERRP